MYLVSQVFKKWRPVWSYHCRVFYVTWKSLSDITDQVAKKFWYTIKDNNIVVWHWSWTWVSRIRQELMAWDKNLVYTDIQDVSVFWF